MAMGGKTSWHITNHSAIYPPLGAITKLSHPNLEANPNPKANHIPNPNC